MSIDDADHAALQRQADERQCKCQTSRSIVMNA